MLLWCLSHIQSRLLTLTLVHVEMYQNPTLYFIPLYSPIWKKKIDKSSVIIQIKIELIGIIAIT